MPIFLAVLSGVLLALSLPPYDFSWLAWFALAPLIFAARGQRVLIAAGLGLICGATAGVIHARFSGEGLVFAWLPFLWFGILCALAAVAARFFLLQTEIKHRLARVFWLACVGVAAEWLTTLTPLPINFAVTQHRVLEIIQIADFSGIWGVSFLLWFCNAAITNAAFLWFETERAPRRNFAVPLAISLVLVACSGIYSHFALSRVATTKVLRVAAIQDFEGAEVPQIGVENVSSSTQNVEKPSRESLTESAAQKGAQFVVWSENCLGSDFSAIPPSATSTKDATRNLARRLKIFLVPGYTDSAGEKEFNCAAIVAPSGAILGVHHKIHLYMAERQTITPGVNATAFPAKFGKVGIAICFDTCWTGAMRQMSMAGAQIVAMPNFDPPAPRGVVHFLHGAMLPFRAIENRVPIVRADPNGHSGTIDSDGRVLAQSEMGISTFTISDVRLGAGKPTIFVRYGDWLAGICGIVALCGGIIFTLERRKIRRS